MWNPRAFAGINSILERKVAEDQSPDWEHWCLLLRAYHSTGNPSKVKEVYARANRYYDIKHRRQLPRQVSEYFQRSQRPDVSFDLSRDRDEVTLSGLPDAGASALPLLAVKPEAERQDLINIVRIIGITTHSELRLKGSNLEPVQVVRRVKQRLWFSGVLASNG